MHVNKFLLEHMTKEDDKNHKFPNMKGDAWEIETQGVHPLEHHIYNKILVISLVKN